MTTFTLLDKKIHLHKKEPYPSEDAIWLASAVKADKGDHLLEAGVGNGAASLCLLQRINNISITGLDCQEDLTKQANDNAKLNNIPPEKFTAIEYDFQDHKPEKAYNHVFANPPFHRRDHGFHTDDATRMMAYGANQEEIISWVKSMINIIEEGGSLTLIHHKRNESSILHLLAAFNIEVIYLCSHAKKPSKRLILRCIKKEENTPSIKRFFINTHNKDIRQHVLYDGKSLWQYCEKVTRRTEKV